MVHTRRRGTAIVDTPNGILVASQRGGVYLLPGGGARHHESRQDAAIRELKEETGLKVVDSTYLFEYKGGVHKDSRGGFFRDVHKVFLVTTTGVAEPGKEIKRIAYYNGSGVNVSFHTKKIIEKYLTMNGSLPEYSSIKCPNDGSPLDVRGFPPYVKCPYDGTILYRNRKGVYRQEG
jgi:8-oxo-dGTP diphosphatase